MPLVPGSAREVPPWVLAGPVLQRLADLIRELRRGFRMHEEVRETPRGQILWQRYVREQMVRGAFHQLPCRFPELGPDMLLRGYLRWGLESVHRSLTPFVAIDGIARRLAEQAEGLLQSLSDAAARPPDRNTLDRLARTLGLPSAALVRGLQALGWIVEERGLAGAAETDGLAWALPMHQLFERWVEHLVRGWARGFGGEVIVGRADETVVPIHWYSGTPGSMKSLVPDLVVRHQEDVYVIDAKYKGHFQELDDARWGDLADELREAHRHDVHQVLAYASLFEGARTTAVLVYPMHSVTWARLASHGRTFALADLTGGGRRVRLALAGVPVELPVGESPSSLSRAWNALFANQW
jgi:5-methylcytosine-specific restriction endonuclease McrBC regulatory subunit McrC